MTPNSQESDRSDGDDGAGTSSNPSTAQKAVTITSILLTVVLFGYAGWQLLSAPTPAPPEAHVRNTSTLSDGRVAVTVELRNRMDTGFETVTVESSCTDPPTELEFTYVPALATRRGTIVCPANTTAPSVTVASWKTR
ncbi:MAG: hypothetical protein ABEI77_05920 [Halorientalis sp.]